MRATIDGAVRCCSVVRLTNIFLKIAKGISAAIGPPRIPQQQCYHVAVTYGYEIRYDIWKRSIFIRLHFLKTAIARIAAQAGTNMQAPRICFLNTLRLQEFLAYLVLTILLVFDADSDLLNDIKI